MRVPARPGHGLSAQGWHFLSALPRIDGSAATEDLRQAVNGLISRIADNWAGPKAPTLPLLPNILLERELADRSQANGKQIPIGLGETHVEPIYLDFEIDPHFFIIGDIECGKSNLLQIIARQLTARFTANEARIIVVDYRRSFINGLRTDNLLAYARTSQELQNLIDQVVAVMRERLSASGATSKNLGDKTCWNGPDLYLLVDDYDLLTNATFSNPIEALAEFLPQARDIGLHLIIARQARGASRAMFERVARLLYEYATPTLLMSGP